MATTGRGLKPLGGKAYTSIGHLPSSRLGPGDHMVTPGMARICELKPRDEFDRIIIQEKLDGSNVAVALIDGQVLALVRAGYLAQSSKYTQHQLFADWVRKREDIFRQILKEGERVCGEWLALAHSTKYDLTGLEPFAAFDIMYSIENKRGIPIEVRLPYDEFDARMGKLLLRPTLLHDGGPMLASEALKLHQTNRWPGDSIEGVVYRVERKGQVDFLAKYVVAGKEDGIYLDGEEVWNWRP